MNPHWRSVSAARSFLPLALLFHAGLAAPAAAQPGANPAVDVSLGGLSSFSWYGRTGTYPAGLNGFTMLTVSCNLSPTVNVPWINTNGTPSPACSTPMDPTHPAIAFLAVRLSDDRLVQVSDRSFLKHGFYALSETLCGSCPAASPGTWLAALCSDTYNALNNSDRFFLGPPDEVNPWTGVWSPCGSHFDRGEPPVSPASAQTDGARSLTVSQVAAMDPVQHRLVIRDADLAVPGALFYYQAQYVLPSWTQQTTTDPCPNPAGTVGLLMNEPDANRTNNLGNRPFTATWTGVAWLVTNPNGPIFYDSVLYRWPGASVASGANGAADGRLYVAVKASGPSSATGLTHYEFAVHNRDNARGAGAIRIPICPGARALNPGFRDLDLAAGNDWTMTAGANEVVFAAPSGNPLLWNSIFNFWFDSDAAPVPGTVLLDEANPGPGAAQVAVASSGPGALWNEYLGAGCGSPAPPALFAAGVPARALLGNATFGLNTTGHGPGAPVLLFASLQDGALPLGAGCTLYSASAASLYFMAGGSANAFGAKSWSVPVPNLPALEGAHLDFQAVGAVAGGAYAGAFELSDGLRVRIGNAITDCP